MRRHFALLVITVALAVALLPLRAEALTGTILGCDAAISVPSLGQNYTGTLIAQSFVEESPFGENLRFLTPYHNVTFNGAPYFGVGSGAGTFNSSNGDTQLSFNVAFSGPAPSGPDINQQSFSVQGNIAGSPFEGKTIVFTGKTFAIRQDGQFGRTDPTLTLTNCRNTFVDP